jgi:hypothetical protein
MTRLTSLGRDVRARIRTFFDTPLDADATPLEIGQAVLDDVERHVQPVGRGRRLFPFATVLVRVHRVDHERTALNAAFEGFDTRLRERLAELRCEAPRVLHVALECLDDPPPAWRPGQLFDVTYVADTPSGPHAAAPASDAPLMAALHVVVLRGAATAPEWRFTGTTVSIGRSSDPTDERGRTRRNRVAFLDIVDGVNETVGRAHARLTCDPVTHEVRLFDDGSRNGTSILRDGEVIAVHRRDPRGVRVRSGDEIQLGRALLRIDFGV